MSQPHDGQRTFPPFGNPFRMIFLRGSYLSPKLFALLNSFEQTLAESLKKLKPKGKSDILSLSWMRQAIESLSETHTNVKTLITDLHFPVSDWDEKWMDTYLDNSVKLLDICIALSSEISRLDQGQLLLQYILHVLDFSSTSPSSEKLRRAHASLCDWLQQINSRSLRLENCSAILQDIKVTLYSTKVKNSAKGKVLMRALDGVKVKTIFVCSVIIAALSGCSKLLIELHVPDKFFWVKAFNDLQTDAISEVQVQLSQGKLTVLKELEDVIKCVERLNLLNSSDCGHKEEILRQRNGVCHIEVVTADKTSQRKEETLQQSNGVNHLDIVTSKNQEEGESWQESVAELAETAERLAHELDLLSKLVGEFFEIVLTGRDALLCNLRVPDVVQDQNRDEHKM